MLRAIVHHPAPILRQVAAPVSVFDSELRNLVADMFETMEASRGVGLAAPQVAVSLRVLVVGYKQHRFEIVNPVVVSRSGEEWDEEGCLSLPNITCRVQRATKVYVKGFSAVGRPIVVREKAYLARILQHEIDHLDGILIIDKGEILPQEGDA